ncbi:DNA polymerase subunit gamma-1, mitochondrial [Plutella xylostella]|uniref:DNA polymerase subunit gamma-1, mitochondrial n=1 Tax=Plutella xylostella TaxID=51655 RepID=UPI002032BD7B|nr:DNA polymerase subunit gamma-1, mitochondrial [Plutella xylostella]
MSCKHYKMLRVSVARIHKIHRRNYCDIFPVSEVRIIRQKNTKNDDNLKVEELPKPNNVSKEFRVNEVNIQLISKNIHEQLFKQQSPKLDPATIKSCQENLKKHGINISDTKVLPDVELKLPELKGKDVVEHFYNIGEEQSRAYRELLEKLVSCDLPPLPKKWSRQAGWSKYVGDDPPQPVPCPTDDALIFDVEVLMSAGKRPTLACAVSPNAWYGWVSYPVANNSPHEEFDNVRYQDLIPLETDSSDEPVGDINRPRIVVGHNVAYDRAKVKEQYWLGKTGVRFMDTMSMHTCVSGVTSYQRAALKSSKEPAPGDLGWMEISSLNSLTEVHKLYCGSSIDKQTRDVFVEGKMADVIERFPEVMSYCAADVGATWRVLVELLPLFMERFPHPVTLAGMLELGSTYLPVNSNWTRYIESSETVFQDLNLESRQLLSLKADEACRLMINEEYKNDLWMWNQDWSTQTLKLKKATKKKMKEISDLQAEFENMETDNDIVQETNSNEDLEAKLKTFKVLNQEYIDLKTKPCHKQISDSQLKVLSKKFQYLFDLAELLPVKRPYLPGYPAWYRKLCTKPGKANNVTTSMQITPSLLRLSWEGYPLHYLADEGWGFLVPSSHYQDEDDGTPRIPLKQLLEKCPVVECKQDGGAGARSMEKLSRRVEEDMGKRTYYARRKLDEQAAANKYHGLGVWTGLLLQGCCHFFRLPHKDGPKYKVGNPLARDFLDMFSQNVLSAQGNDAEKVLLSGRMMSYWRNNRSRILGQQVVWRSRDQGAILPQVVVAGTLTRRASEPTWMTASNAHAERVGSELRAMVQAPPGYRFIGADVDSQELWIAALLGDSSIGLAGGSAFGWSVLAGSKQAGSDLHSLTASAIGVSRDHAKVINYARIYGAGQNFAERLLKQFNPTMTNAEAKHKAAKMFASTKGKRVYTLKKQYMEGFMEEDVEDQTVEMAGYNAMRLAKLSGRRVDEMFERARWVGGTESDMFNKLEEIADSEAPSTAFLSGRLSRALEAESGRYDGTKHNWVVQSAAADFLHLMLVCMRDRAPEARFCLSFHDEVRYLVPDEHRYEAALALQLTNLMTRAFCSQRVGMNDLPLSVAFFTSVEVDAALRKESNLSCVTPSNPHGLEKGYGIPDGESLDIFAILEKCGMKSSVSDELK